MLSGDIFLMDFINSHNCNDIPIKVKERFLSPWKHAAFFLIGNTCLQLIYWDDNHPHIWSFRAYIINSRSLLNEQKRLFVSSCCYLYLAQLSTRGYLCNFQTIFLLVIFIYYLFKIALSLNRMFFIQHVFFLQTNQLLKTLSV